MLSGKVVVEYGEGIYKDTGCQFYPKCLECPFPDCLLDQVSVTITQGKRVEARELARRGVNKVEIAKRLRVTERTVRNYLEKVS